MVRALVLVRLTSASVVSDFVEVACNVKGVSDAYPVFGRFDVAILLAAKDFSGISEIARKIRQIKGIKNTETLPEAI